MWSLSLIPWLHVFIDFMVSYHIYLWLYTCTRYVPFNDCKWCAWPIEGPSMQYRCVIHSPIISILKVASAHRFNELSPWKLLATEFFGKRSSFLPRMNPTYWASVVRVKMSYVKFTQHFSEWPACSSEVQTYNVEFTPCISFKVLTNSSWIVANCGTNWWSEALLSCPLRF